MDIYYINLLLKKSMVQKYMEFNRFDIENRNYYNTQLMKINTGYIANGQKYDNDTHEGLHLENPTL